MMMFVTTGRAQARSYKVFAPRPRELALRATGWIGTMMMFATIGRAQARSYNSLRSRWVEAAGAALGVT